MHLKVFLRIKIFFQNYWPLIVILFYSLVPLSWFKNDYLLAGGDEMSYLNPAVNFLGYTYAWLEKINAGSPNVSLYSIFPYKFFWVFFGFFGLSIQTIEKFWVGLLFILPGVSMFFLVSFLTRNYPKFWSGLAALASATFYMFNIFTTLNPIQSSTRLILFALPLCLLFWIKALNSDSFKVKYPIYIGLVSVFITSASANLPLVGLIPISFLFYSLFFIIFKRGNFRLVFKNIIFTVFVYLLFNLCWIVNLFFVKAGGAEEEIKSSFQEAQFLESTPVWEAFRLMGHWSFRTHFEGQPLVSYALYYYQLPLLVLTLLLPILSFLPVLFKKKQKEVLFFVFLALGGVFLAKGISPPAGSIYAFLTARFPYFWIYRNPFAKFSLFHLFSYSVLLGYTIIFLSRLEPKKLFKPLSGLFFIIFVLLAFATSFPLVFGKVYNPGNIGNNRSFYASVPSDWQKLSIWLKNNDPESRIFLLPKAAYGMAYNWKSGVSGAGYAANFLLPNSLMEYVHNSYKKGDQMVTKLYEMFQNEEGNNLNIPLKIFDVKYILHQKDIATASGLFIKPDTQEKVKALLSNKEGIEKINSFGLLDLYRVKDYSLNRILPLECFNLTLNYDTLADKVLEEKSSSLCSIFILSDLNKKQKDLLFSTIGGKQLLHNLGFTGMKGCPSCTNQIGFEFNYLIPKEKYSQVLDELRSRGAVEVIIKEKTNYSILVSVMFSAFGIKKVSPDKQWIFDNNITGLNNGGVFETTLPEKFPEKLISAESEARFFMVIKGEEPIKLIPSTGTITSPGEGLILFPKKLIIGVLGEEVKDKYLVNYLENIPQDPMQSWEVSQLTKRVSVPLSFKKINPTRYEITVENTKNPFLLTLFESYSPFWKAVLMDVKGKRGKIAEEFHLLSFGYSNSWLINKTGTFKIVLLYQPQRYLSITTIISLISIVIGIYCLFRFKRKGSVPGFFKEEIIPEDRLTGSLSALSKILYVGFIYLLFRIAITVSAGAETVAQFFGSLAFGFIFFVVLLNALVSFKRNNNEGKNKITNR